MEARADAEAVAYLREFLVAMRQWQLDCSKRDQELKMDKSLWEKANRLNEKGYIIFENNQNTNLANFRGILEKYCVCTKKIPVAVSYCDPPNFDGDSPVIEIVEKGNKIVIVIERLIDLRRLQYTLFKTDKGLKISDQVKIFDPIKKKFVSFDITL